MWVIETFYRRGDDLLTALEGQRGDIFQREILYDNDNAVRLGRQPRVWQKLMLLD